MAQDPSAKNAKTQNCEMQQENVSFEPEWRMVPEAEQFRHPRASARVGRFMTLFWQAASSFIFRVCEGFFGQGASRVRLYEELESL